MMQRMVNPRPTKGFLPGNTNHQGGGGYHNPPIFKMISRKMVMVSLDSELTITILREIILNSKLECLLNIDTKLSTNIPRVKVWLYDVTMTRALTKIAKFSSFTKV